MHSMPTLWPVSDFAVVDLGTGSPQTLDIASGPRHRHSLVLCPVAPENRQPPQSGQISVWQVGCQGCQPPRLKVPERRQREGQRRALAETNQVGVLRRQTMPPLQHGKPSRQRSSGGVEVMQVAPRPEIRVNPGVSPAFRRKQPPWRSDEPPVWQGRTR